VILPTLLGLAASILLLSQARSLPLLVVSGAAFGLAQGISYPTLHALIVDLSVESNLGRAQALFNGAFNLGVTSSAFVFGLVAEHAGHRAMFAFAALTPVAGWLVFYVYGKHAVTVPSVISAAEGPKEEVPCDLSSTPTSVKRTVSA